MQWSFILDGQQYDPVDEETLLTYLQSGQVPLDALVWQEGMPEWVPAKIAFAMQLNTGPASAPARTRRPARPSKAKSWPEVIAVILLLMSIGYSLSGLFAMVKGSDMLQGQLSSLVRNGVLGRGQANDFIDGAKVKIVAAGFFALVTGMLGFFGAISLFRKQYSSGNLIILFSSVLIFYLIFELVVSLSVGADLVAAIKAATGRSLDLTAQNGAKIVFRLFYLGVPSFFILWFTNKKVRRYMKENFEVPAIWQ